MASNGMFESPLCNHRFTKGQLNSLEQVSCDCGYVFDSEIALRYLAEEEKIETAKSWLANAQVALESLKMQLIGKANRNLTAPVKAASAPSVASATVTTSPPRKITPPPVPAKPKRAPLSPRAILLIVAGTLTLIGVSAGLATTWSVLPDWAKAAVVLLLVIASGVGAVRARNFIRALANFLAILSSSLLLLGLYAEALLNPALHDSGATDASRSLYVPICLLVVSAASAWAGRRFRVNGWLFLPALGVAVSAALTSLAFVPRIGYSSGEYIGLASNGTWQLLAISVGGLLTAYAGRFTKISVPSYEKPTPDQEFEVLEVARESTASRQILRLAYLAALAQLTIVAGLIAVAAVAGHRPDYLGLLTLGAFWIFGAWFLETRGSSFTSSGKVSARVVWGAWILGFGSLAVTAGTWVTQTDLNLKANYPSAITAALVGAFFALSQNIVPWIRKYPIGQSVSRAVSWVVWGGWVVSTGQLSLANGSQVGVLVLFLVAVSATWFAVRYLEKTGKFQIHALAPAAIAAILWSFATHTLTNPALGELVVNTAMHLIFASVLVAFVGYLTIRMNRTVRADFSVVGYWIINATNVLVVLGALVTTHFYWQGADSKVASEVFWPLFLAAMFLAVGRLASTGASMVSEDGRVRSMALIGAISLLTLPYMQLAIYNIGGELKGVSGAIIAVTLLNLAIVSAYSFWQRSNGFALSILPLAGLLAVSTGVFAYPTTVQSWGIAFMAIPLTIVGAFTIGSQVLTKKRLTLSEDLLGGSALVVFAGTILFHFFTGQIAQATMETPNSFADGGQLNAWVNAATLLVFGGLALFSFLNKRVASSPAGLIIANGFGWISLAAAPLVSEFTASPTELNAYLRLTLVFIALTAISVAHSKLLASDFSVKVAFWTGSAGIWLGLQTIAISTAARETSLGTLLLTQIGFFATLLIVAWNWLITRLANGQAQDTEEPRFSRLEFAVYGSLLIGLLHLNYLALPTISPATSGLILLPKPEVLQWLTLASGTLVLILILSLRLTSLKNQTESNSRFRISLATWGTTAVLINMSFSDNTWWINALELGILALAMFVDGYFSQSRLAILIGFGSSVLGGWVLASQIFYHLHFPLSQLFNFAAIASFVLATWLLSRDPKGFNLDPWSIVLPIVSGISMFLGLSYRFIFFAYDAQRIGGWLLEVEWVIALTLAIAYLFISKHRLLESMKRARQSAVFSSALSWFLAWPIVLSSSMNTTADSLRIAIFSLISIAALFTFAAKFESKRALYFGYVVGLPFALGLSQLTRWAFNWIEPQAEVFALALTLVSVAGTLVYRRGFGTTSTSDYSWGIPVLAALLPSTIQTITVSYVRLSLQTDVQIWRFVILNVLAALILVAGVRIGKRGLVWPTTAVLLLGLVPNLYYRIEDVFPDVRVQAEMKALLFATTIYVLIYLIRKTQKLAIPSLVAIGVPAVISISVLFLDTLGAVQQNTLDSGDWIRFLVLIVVGTAFLTLGAIRKIAGLFYPGIVAVLVAAIPYAWQKTNYGSWVVLLLLAGLIVWVAIRLERFTGWLKELK